jgi:Domain of unknown function (DUF4411)
LKQYTIDTNVFRYKANPKAEPEHKKAAKTFWKQVLQEIQNGQAVLYVPKEVVRELEIQSFTLGTKENTHISDLLEICEEPLPDIANTEIEHKIRELAAYSRATFGGQTLFGRKMEYPGVSDARVMYSAYEKDTILVTSNIKDFLLYPLLFEQGDDQDRLYDLLDNSFINLNPGMHQNVHSNATFKGLLQDLYELEIEAETKET